MVSQNLSEAIGNPTWSEKGSQKLMYKFNIKNAMSQNRFSWFYKNLVGVFLGATPAVCWHGVAKPRHSKTKIKPRFQKWFWRAQEKVWCTLYKKILTQKNHHEPTWHIFDTCLVTYSSKIQLKNKGGVQENLHWIAWSYEVFKFQCG